MPRGGMCANAFAGNPSMNNLDDDFMKALFQGKISVEQAIALRIIKMSVRDYLYFGLGKNGITPTKFLDAYDYLFISRANDSSARFNSFISGRHRNVDDVLQTHKSAALPKKDFQRCFDTHYHTSRLAESIPLSNFLARLKKKREVIINANIKQVLAYMEEFRREEWNKLPIKGRKGKHAFPRVGVVHTLISPEDCRSVAMLYLYGRTIHIEKRPAMEEKILPTNLLNYKKLLFPEGVK
jgi:hypothetical protein